MHLGLRQLEEFLSVHRGVPHLVLATVTGTEGSSYRKPGAMMLIGPGGDYAGMISGGCLEGDLLEHATRVLADGQARTVRYDLSDPDHAPWGLGLGCGGVVDLLLQRLTASSGFGFLQVLFDRLAKRQVCTLGLLLDPFDDLGPGTFGLLGGDKMVTGAPRICAALAAPDAAWSAASRWQLAELADGKASARLLKVRIEPSPCVLICGAGPDAVPLARQVDALGWPCIVADHRPAFAAAGRFPASAKVLCVDPAELSARIDLGDVDAAVVMTHNLRHDATYLRQLVPRALPYLALLGPRKRRLELVESLGMEAPDLRGPAGLDIGAELPESIALSIMAEMHGVLDGARSGSGKDH